MRANWRLGILLTIVAVTTTLGVVRQLLAPASIGPLHSTRINRRGGEDPLLALDNRVVQVVRAPQVVLLTRIPAAELPALEGKITSFYLRCVYILYPTRVFVTENDQEKFSCARINVLRPDSQWLRAHDVGTIILVTSAGPGQDPQFRALPVAADGSVNIP